MANNASTKSNSGITQQVDPAIRQKIPRGTQEYAEAAEQPASYYPVYLNLRGKTCVIIGGGKVAEGKIAKLRDSGASVRLISLEVTPGLRQLAADGNIEWHEREFRSGDLNGAFIAIAATDQRAVNQRIFEEAESLGVLLNAVDDPPRCTFIAPSIVQRGPVTLAISTGGASPALARKLRESLSAAPEMDWADVTNVLARARKHLKETKTVVDPQRWQCCLTPQLLELAKSGREDDAVDQLLSGLLGTGPNTLCSRVETCQPGGCRQKGPDG